MHFFSISEGQIGFSSFGLFHLTWLALFVIGGYLGYKPFSEKKRLYFILPLIPFVLKVFRLFMLVITDQFYSWDELPLHICNLSLLVFFIYGLTRWKGLHNYMFAVALPAALLALLFPGFGNLPTYSYYTFESFISHGILVIYPLYLLKLGELVPDFKKLPKLMLALVICAIPIHFVNVVLDTNFCFIEHPLENSPLVFLEDFFHLPYHYCLLAVMGIIWLIVYGLYYTVLRTNQFLVKAKKHAA